ELFGTTRGRVGYGPKRWFTFGTAGLGWMRNQFTAGQTAAGAPTSTAMFRQRIGWTLGAGIERASDRGWSVNGEYLYTRFGKRDLESLPVTEFTSRLSTSQLRIGLHYALSADPGSNIEPLGIAPIDLEDWNVHAQTTFVGQYAAPFNAPYHGANSLDPNIGR